MKGIVDFSKMTPDQVRAALAQMSGFNGQEGFQFESAYTGALGMGNGTLDFNGDNASLLDAGNAEPFTLVITNAKNAARAFYLSVGLLYNPSNLVAGMLRTGVFAAINDTGGDTSLTAETYNPISIEQFIAYYLKYPTYVPLIQATSTAATAQLATTWQYYKQGMIKNEAPTNIPMRKYANGDQFNLQFQDFNESIYLSRQDIFIVSVAASSTLTLNIYPLVAKNSRKALSSDVNAAQQAVATNPALVQQIDKAVKLQNNKRLALASTIGGL